MISLSEKSKETASSLLNLLNTNAEGASSFSDSTPNVEILGNIYKLMVKQVSLDMKQDEYDDELNDKRHFLAEKRHKEIIAVLTLPKKKIKSVEKKKKEKRNKKETAKETPSKNQPEKITKKQESPQPVQNVPAKEVAPKVVESSPVLPALKTASVLGATGFASAASAISLRGETGKGHESALKNVGQIVNNDPEPGYKSYGLFGMNSKAKTIDNFVAQNPQLGLTTKPGSPEFDREWKEVAKNKPQDLYQAQMNWYEKNILSPLQNDLMKMLPANVAGDQRVVAYMADRRIQYGKVLESSAIQYANSDKPETFINRITEYDLENIGKAFTTYLKTHPGSEKV